MMKKKMMALLLSLAMLLSLVPVTAVAEGANISMALTYPDGRTAETLQKGDTVTLTVSNNAMTVSSFTFNVSFDKEKFECVSIAGSMDGYPDIVYIKSTAPVLPEKLVTTKSNISEANDTGSVGFGWSASENATYVAGKIVTITFEAKDFGSADFILNEDSAGQNAYKNTVSTTSVTVVKAPIEAASATIAAPTKGQEFPSTVTIPENAGYSASVAWYTDANCETAASGNVLGGQTYYAKITLTPDTANGESFADSVAVTGTVTGDYVPVDGSLVLTASFTTTARVLSGITIDTAPTKTTYEVDEKFSPDGMVVTAAYDDGTSETVTNYTWSPNGALAATNTDITVSYEGKTATQKITVTKYDVTLTYENGTATYDGTTDYASTAAKRIKGFQEGLMGSLSVFFKLNDSVVNQLIDAGTYKVYASTEEGTKYNALGETELGTFTITKAAIKPSVSLEDWTYGETAKNPSVSGNTGNGTVTYSYAAKGTNDFYDTVPTNAGSYTVKATIAESANYQGGEATADFAITKAKVTAPPIAAKTYNGENQTADVAESDLYTVTSNAGGTTVGAYNVALTLTDSANYKWADSEEAAKTLSFQITKATAPAVTAPTLETVTYDPNKTLADVHLPTGWSWTDDTIVPTVMNNGYDAALTVDDTNYDYTGVDRYDAQSHKVTRVVSLTVTKADPTFTAPTGLSLTYDGSDQTLIQPGSTQCGELRYSLNTESYSVIPPDGRDAQSYTVYYVLIGGDNYKNVHGSVTATITQAENSISNLDIKGWTYGENAKAPSATATFGTVAYTYGSSQSGTFSEEVPTEAGTWYVKATVAERPNYKGAEAVKPFTIAQREVTLTWGESSFTYDGQPHAPTATAGNLKAGDTVIVTVNGEKIEAGDNYTAEAVSLSNDNYSLPETKTQGFSIAKADIAQAQLAGQMTVRSKTAKPVTFTLPTLPKGASYETPAIDTNTDGLIDGTAAPAVSGTTLSFSVTSKEKGKTATINVPVNGGNNYNNATYTLTVTSQDKDDAGVTVAAGSSTVTYGDSLTVTGSAKPQAGSGTWTWISSNSAVVAVSGNGASPTVTVKGAGTATITGTFENDDYLGTNTATVTVTQREVTLTWGTATFNYDGKSHVPAVTLGNVKTGDTVNVTVTGEQTNAGTNYTATAASLDNGNYKLPAANTHSFTINKVASAVTTAPTAQNLTYTGTAQALVSEGEATGGAMQYSLDGTNYSTTIPTGTDVGRYTVYYKVVGDENHNNTARASVKVNIAKADAGYNAPTAQKLTYNGQAQPLVTAGSTVDGTMQYRLGYGTWGTTVPTATKAGTYTVYYRVTGDKNHNDVAAASVSVTIARKAVTVTADNADKVYGAADPGRFTATVYGTVGNDKVTYTLRRAAGENVGAYDITASGNATQGNYDVTFVNGTFTITKATNAVTGLTISGWTYGDKANAPRAKATFGTVAYTYSNAESGDFTATVPVNAGTWYVKAAVAGTDNYDGAQAVKSFTIAPKAVTVTANNATKVYGAEDPALTAKVSGTVGSDTVAYTVNRDDGEDVKSYAITASGAATQGNYEVSYVNGTFTITKANAAYTAPAAKTDLTYNGQAQALVTAGMADGGELQYKLGNGTYGIAIPTATEAGTYSVYYKVVGDKNHNSVSEARITVTIAPLSENTAAVSEGNAEVKNDAADVEPVLAGMEQYSDDNLNLPEDPTEKAKARQEAVKEAMVAEAKMTAAKPSALYYVNTKNTRSTISFALPASSAKYNFKVMYMADDGTIEEVKSAQVTANGIEVEVPAGADGVYMVAYTPKPVHVVDDSAPTPGGQSIITDLKDINKVTVDGKTVDPKNYTVSGGVVTLSEAYVRTLSNGKHTVRVENAKYISTAVITVSNSTVKSAGTGDAGLGLYAMLALSSVTGAAWLGLKKRKED